MNVADWLDKMEKWTTGDDLAAVQELKRLHGRGTFGWALRQLAAGATVRVGDWELHQGHGCIRDEDGNYISGLAYWLEATDWELVPP